MREPDVRHEPRPKKVDTRPRASTNWSGITRSSGLALLLQADRAGRQDVVHAQCLQPVDIALEIELRRHDPMPEAVAGEKGDALAAQRSDQYAADGSPNALLTWRSSRSVSSAMSAQTAPPMMPMLMDIAHNFISLSSTSTPCVLDG